MPSYLGSLKSKRALAVRHHGADSAQAAEAARNLRIEKLAIHAETVVASWPTPTPDQLAKVVAILQSGVS